MAWGKHTKESHAAPTQAEVASRLLSEILERKDQASPLNILDLGTGQAATVNFFAQCPYPTKLIFGDISDAQPLFTPHRESDEPANFLEIVDLWRKYLSLPTDFSIDILLSWDLLHYFNLLEVEALSSVLQPHLIRGAQGYGFGAMRNAQKLPNFRYAVKDAGHIRMAPNPGPPPQFAHSQQSLTENFVCMQISRGTLLQEGHLELLFRY